MRRIRVHRSLFHLACLGLGVAGALLMFGGHDAPPLNAPPQEEVAVSPLASLRAEMLGLPAVIYIGENLSYLVHVENSSPDARTIRVVHADPWARQEQTVTLASGESADVPFVLRAASPVSKAAASVSLFSVADPQHSLWQKMVWLRDGRGDVSDIRAAGRGYTDGKGAPVVLVNNYENETQYRRWAPVKWAAREWQRRGAPVILSAPEGFEAACDGDAGLARKWKFIPYQGDPLSACLGIDSEIPAQGAVLVCLAWGTAEATGSVSVRDFARALDLAIDRIRKRNPAVQVALVTPTPSPATPEAISRCAEAIRALAREHHAQLIDLAAKTLDEKDWPQMYALDGDARIAAMYPQGEGLEKWGEWLKRGLMDEESFAEGERRLEIGDAITVSDVKEPPPNDPPTKRDAQFPGIATILSPASFPRAPKAICADVLIPTDAPRALQVSLFLKDKDGIWFQSAPVAHLAHGTWQRIRFDLDPSNGLLSARGHNGAWNAFYAAHMVETGLQFFAPTQWKGALQVGNILMEDEAPASSSPLRIINFEQLTGTPEAYSVAELSFDLSRSSARPFDPSVCQVEATLRSPSGAETRVSGFYYQPYRRELNAHGEEALTPDGCASWRVRFTPLEPGRYSWKLTARAEAETVETAWHALEVKPGGPRGFVRVSQKDPRYFETADGAFFYPIGHNIHSPFDKRSAEMLKISLPPNRGTFAYDDYFEKMAANGENSVIIWMCNWWVSIEWTGRWKGFHGLGDYNMESAWRIDYLLDAAARHGIHVLFVLDNHGKLSGYVDSEWATNPYNVVNGGPCRKPEDFFTDPRAWQHYRNRLDYIAARWGGHPNLLGYEIVSEMNLVGGSAAFRKNPAHAQWVRKVGQHLRSIDPGHHPVTIQYSTDWQSVDQNVAALPELDFLVGDAYKAGGYIVPLMVKTAQENGRFGKPTFCAEFGGNWNATTPARLRADLHAGLWSNAMTPSGGAPFFWWFDFVDRNNLYYEYRALANFMQGEDRRGLHGRSVYPPVLKDDAESEELCAVCMVGEGRAYFWIYDKLAAEIMPEDRFLPSHSNVFCFIPNLAPGRYLVEYWDVRKGARLFSTTVETDENAGLKLSPPTFGVDIAGKVKFIGRTYDNP